MAVCFTVLAANMLGFDRLQPALVVGDTATSKAKMLEELNDWMTESSLCRLEDDALPPASLVCRSMTRAEAWTALLTEMRLSAKEIPMDGVKFTSRSCAYWQTSGEMSPAPTCFATEEPGLD